ncbi:MAG TPA: serine/threonine-protein kinase, partial [Terriglobia bacterium]|nr:serine/threonine-protein kinase [Terriglobia bacterium]
MGRVLLAFDEALQRKVAIKVLSSRFQEYPALRERFMQEARAMARLIHPNIVRIYSLGPAEEPPHFVMEYVEGAHLLEAARALNLEQKAELMSKVARAVEFLHQHQVVHRDLKPANILVGPDLEPRLLDFGLALQTDAGRRLSLPGDLLGTPEYFSPEQARADRPLDARSDIFSLGVLLYELLTFKLPFRGETLRDVIRVILQEDPVLPRRINPEIPGELQNICMKALEKNPADRYESAQDLADDLERFQAGEPVLAAPASYSRLMSAKIGQHLRELQGWKQDHLLSESEFDKFRRQYDRLTEREDAWILEVRRLSLQQVSLYLGAWILVLGAALVVFFDFLHLTGTPSVLTLAAATIPTALTGIHAWRHGRKRIGVAFLLAFCLMLPTVFLVAFRQYGIFIALSHNDPALELFERSTNAQLWWALALSLPAYYGLRHFTRSSVYSLVFAVMGALLCLVTLLRMGALKWLDADPGQIYLRLLPFGIAFLLVGILVEKFGCESDARYFDIVFVVFTFASLSGVALFHEPYADWLARVFPRTRGQIEYLFILNAGVYLALQSVLDRVLSVPLHTVAKIFRFVIPGHILTSLLLLGLAASDLWGNDESNLALRHEARFFEFLLPIAACFFVFGSIPKQMKNYLATGMLFVAIGIVRLQQDFFESLASWPVSLLVTGFLVMLAAANYSRLKVTASRALRRLR